MRTVLFIILSFLLLVHVAVADPDKAYWSDINQYQLAANDSFHVDDYTITLLGVKKINTGKSSVFLNITNNTTEDLEDMNYGDTIFLSNNSTQFTYVRTDFANREVFAAWREKVPSLTLTSVIVPVINTSSCNANFTLKNVGAGISENTTVDFTIPIGTDLTSTKTLFRNVNLGETATATNSTTIFYSSALLNKTIIAHVAYTYNQGVHGGSFSKLLYMPMNDSTVTTTVSNIDEQSFATVPLINSTVNTTVSVPPAVTSTPISIVTTGATTTNNPSPTVNTTKKPRVVAFRLHPASVETPTPAVVSDTSSQDVQPFTIPATMPALDFTITKGEKRILLICTLLFGWFIIYKL
jgi:hypothetical protein